MMMMMMRPAQLGGFSTGGCPSVQPKRESLHHDHYDDDHDGNDDDGGGDDENGNGDDDGDGDSDNSSNVMTTVMKNMRMMRTIKWRLGLQKESLRYQW